MSVRQFGVGGQSNFAVIGGGYKAQVLGDGPSVYYRLDETTGTTIHDSTSNARDGAIVGTSVTLDQPGAIASEPSANSLKLTAQGTYINTPSAAWMNDTSAQSVELWLKPGTNYNNAGVASRWTGAVNTMLMWYNTGGLLEHRWTIGGSNIVATMNLPMLMVWSYIVATYDGTNVKLYCNAQLVATTPATGSIATGTADLQIGTYQSSGAGTGFGIGDDYIDEFAMYPYALTAARIQAHYTAALAA